jgi:methylglutaconyl-CoA hydratase
MSDDLVILERTAKTATCILNRPAKRNALNLKLMSQLCAHLSMLEKDKTIRAWILRANGPVFCAGLDLGEGTDPKHGIESAKMVKECLSAIYNLPVVTVAVVHGPAIGGGAGLVAACDFAVADREATIGFPEVRRGLIAAQVMSLLVRKLKIADVKDLLLSGELIGAARAMQIGLFNRLGDPETEAQAIIAQVLRGGPQAIAETKRLIDRLHPARFDDDLEMCMRQYLQTRDGEEAQEGIRSFLEKRQPEWEQD